MMFSIFPNDAGGITSRDLLDEVNFFLVRAKKCRHKIRHLDPSD